MPRIAAGIVTYNPDISRLKENINSILPQVEAIYIVDNNSKNIRDIESLCAIESRIELIENDDNYGIARALNQMSISAYEVGFDWILTLDQDTVSPHDMILKMQPYMCDKELGIICPAVYYEGWGKCTATKEATTYVYACMTSASLTRIKAWKKVGGFREEYFIDYVDNEFCMKLKLHGYKVLRVNTCVVKHKLGEGGEIKIGHLRYKYSIHSSLRYYYMIRNNIVFIKEYIANLYVIKEYLKVIYIIISVFIISNNKKETAHYIRRGIIDANRNQMGQYK